MAKRERGAPAELKVARLFEPSRIAHALLAQAYEAVVPMKRRSAGPRAEAAAARPVESVQQAQGG